MEKGRDGKERERAGDNGLLVVPGGRPWRICWPQGPEIICEENCITICRQTVFRTEGSFPDG